MATALVTGASGFIGSTLIEELVNEGYHVKALLRASSSRSNLGNAPFEVSEGSLADLSSLKKACEGVDVVFHLAGVTAGPNREFYFLHNTQGTANLVRAAAEVRGDTLKRFVFVSSLAAGGPSRLGEPRNESSPDAPVSAYGESKLHAENEVLRFKNRLPVTIVRPPMVYGPRDRGVYVIIKTLASGLNLLLPSQSGSASKEYSMIHSEDLVGGILLAGSRPTESGEIYYLTDGVIHPYSEIVEAILHALGRRKALNLRVPAGALKLTATTLTWLGSLTQRQFPLNRDKLNEILPDAWTCSDSKARAELSFQSRNDLTRGMEGTIRWYREMGWL